MNHLLRRICANFFERSALRINACGMALLLALTGCGRMATMVSPYQLDIQQGNVVTQEMVDKLKTGMSRSQVRFALGSPLIVDPFRNDRWDYVYTYQKQGKETENRRVVVLFQDDKLLRIEGDALPQDPVGRSSAKSGRVADADASTADSGGEQPKKERGFFGRMMDKLGF